MAYLINGQPVNIRKEYFRADGVRYENLLNPAVRAKLGVVETSDPDPFEPNEPWYDQRFYWGVNNPKLLNDRPEVKEDGTPLYVQTYNHDTQQMEDTAEQVVTKGLKTQWIAQTKDTANKLLAQTDWMVIRKAEREVDIPDDVAQARAKIVADCAAKEAAILACTTVEELISTVSN
jgi:hypothetical protein